MTQAMSHSADGHGHTGADPRDKLGQMAGQIADFFKAYPEEQAAPAIAAHINEFWSRRMRADFLARFTGNDADLPPLVRKAMEGVKPPQHRD